MTTVQLSKILVEVIEALERTRLEPLPFRDSQVAAQQFYQQLRAIGGVITILNANKFEEKGISENG